MSKKNAIIKQIGLRSKKMTEAEKIIESFIQLLEKKDNVLEEIRAEIPKMQEELKDLSSSPEIAELIQKYCREYPEIREKILEKTRANMAEWENKQPSTQPAYDLERAINTFLMDDGKAKEKSSAKNKLK